MRESGMDVEPEAPHNSKIHQAIESLKNLLEPTNETKFEDTHETRLSLYGLMKKALHRLENMRHKPKDESSETSSDASDVSDDKSFRHKRGKWAEKAGEGKIALKREWKQKWKLIQEDILKGSNTAVESWETVNARLQEAKRKWKDEWKDARRKARESAENLKEKVGL